MKTINSVFLGILSSLLLTIGLVRAAQVFDPVARNSATSTVCSATPAPDCTSACDYLT